MLGYSKSATVVFIHLFLLFLGPAHAAPTIPEKRTVNTALRVRQENLEQSTTVTTTDILQTSVGPMLQTCTIQLDPITDDQGKPMVRETRTCKVEMMNGAGGNGDNGGNGSGNDGANSSEAAAPSATDAGDGAQSTDSAASNTDTATATDASATSSAESASATATDASASATATDASASASTDAASASATASAINDNGITLVPGSELPSGATGAPTASATASGSDSAAASATPAPGNGAISPGGFSTIDASAVATETAASGSPTASGDSASAAGAAGSATSAADTAETSAAKFELPGTHLSVLPIGLGVFAGISVIALIVVGLVTYERTKYRKAFRQRKLAESGAAMGYGGMAQAA